MPGPFGQPAGNPYDMGAELGMGYQQDAANRISQKRVSERRGYTSGYAGKYGISDVAKATKGLSDTDIYELATNLVNKRRGPTKPAAGPPGSGTAPKVTPKPAAKPGTAPKVTAKTSTTKTAAATTARRTTRRRRRTTSRTTSRAAAPTISATRLSTLTRLASS